MPPATSGTTSCEAMQGVGHEEPLDLAREEELRKGDRGGDAQRAAHLVSGLGREDRVGAGKEVLGFDEELFVVGRERHRARRAVEELHAEERLEFKKLACGDRARETPEGAILIDTLHEPFVGRLIENLGRAGVAPAYVRWVLMTHGHFDHVGAATPSESASRTRASR